MRRFSAFAFIISTIFSGAALADAGLPQASTLSSVFEQSWQRQPFTAALGERQRALAARRNAADALLAAPPALELGTRSDRLNRNQGARELDVALALPLWLPGERSGTQAVAGAEVDVLASRVGALRLELARQLRELWWAWQAAANEQGLAVQRQRSAEGLRDDVARRFAAGDLSRADLNQAEGLAAQARAQRAEANTAEMQARFRLESLSGPLAKRLQASPEPLPAVLAAPASASSSENHPRLQELQGLADLALRQSELARLQARSNPELAISTRYDRSSSALADEQQTWAVSLRIPFGGGPRHDARVATANAEAQEAGAALRLEQERLAYEVVTLRSQFAAAEIQVTAAEERSVVAQANRGFYEKSFRLGESDLPTRLRIEAEAIEAERALGAARIARARTLSQLRQALGLLPE